MFKSAHIQTSCGSAALTYALNKARGGASGQKGTRYEDHFAVFKIAELAAQSLSNSSGLKGNGTVKFQGQVLCFVDDLILSGGRSKLHEFFQLKNVQSISWGAGQKSLAWNFRCQRKLSRSLGKTAKLSLVLSDASLVANLKNSRPHDLRSVNVVYFPYHTRYEDYVQNHHTFDSVVTKISAFSSPSTPVKVGIAKMLLAAWVDSGGSAVELRSILTELQETRASFVRPIKGNRKLPTGFCSILSAIPDFDFKVYNGHLHWTYLAGLESGVIPHNCHSAKFNKFMDWVVRTVPTTYDDIEGWLT